MLTEIEERLATVLREKLDAIPITINTKPNKLPAVIITNLKFKFRNAGLVENVDQGKVELQERFTSDGAKTSFNLKEKPLKKSVRVEFPSRTLLSEKHDYVVNYDKGCVDFATAPEKGKGNIFVRYSAQKKVFTLKSLKVKALYSIDVLSRDRSEADSLAERVVKIFLAVEDQFLAEDIEVKPVGGETSTEEDGKTAKVQLRYIVEKEIRVEQTVGPIEKIEITRKGL